MNSFNKLWRRLRESVEQKSEVVARSNSVKKRMQGWKSQSDEPRDDQCQRKSSVSQDEAQNSIPINDQNVHLQTSNTENDQKYRSSDENLLHSPAIFRLNVDCFEELFDWLSVEELHTLGQTCQRIQQVAGYYVQQNFSSLEAFCEDDGVYVHEPTTRVDGFSPFIRKLIISDDVQKHDLRRYVYAATKCKSLKELCFRSANLTAAKIDCIKGILSQIEVLDISGGSINCNFYTQFLAFCPNLKRLKINKFKNGPESVDIGNWLQQNYPKLETFELNGDKNVSTAELIEFLRKNPNIRNFTTDDKCILLPRFVDLIVEYELNVDDFTISKDYSLEELKSFACEQCNKLQRHGFFRRLHFQRLTNNFNQETITQIASLQALNSLLCGLPLSPLPTVSWSPLAGLRKLTILYYPELEVGFHEMAKSLVNLEEIALFQVTHADILPFIFHAVKLRSIKVQHFIIEHGDNFGPERRQSRFCDGSVLHLAALNRERKRLNGAKKVIIYIDKNLYLKTKWAIGQTDFDLVEIKRHFFNYNW